LVQEDQRTDFAVLSRCKIHNPYIISGMAALIDSMVAVQKQQSEGIMKGSKADFRLIIRHVFGDGDTVAVHPQISGSQMSEGRLRHVHLFRFTGI
jgi:predicted SnoaL-like aldol condensation-catalyzing enzyme